MAEEKPRVNEQALKGVIAVALAFVILIYVISTANEPKAPQKMVAHSGTISAEWAGCLTEDALSEMISAASRKDLRQMNTLLGSGICADLKGREYSVAEIGVLTSRIRVYSATGSALLYVPSGAIVKNR